MKTITTSKGEFLFVEVPDDATRFYIRPFVNAGIGYYDSKGYQNHFYINDSRNYQIISSTKDITEEQAESIVYYHLVGETKYYSNYMPYESMDFRDVIDNSFKTAKESLQSLIQANELDINKTYLILKKINHE